MSNTPVFKFRLVAENTTESGKAASANENALIAEALFKQRVESRSTAAPPVSPSDGQVYIVPDASASPAPSGAWAGHEDEIAIYYNGWLFVEPVNGPVFYVADEDLYVKYDDTASPPAWIVGGVDTFLGLSDSPASYSGQAGKSVVVNSGETGLEFGAGAFSGAKATLSANQAISSGTNTVIDWDGTEEYDTDSYHESATNPDRITIPSDGHYRITVVPRTDQEASTNVVQYWITKNGTDFADRVAYSDAYGAAQNGVPCIFEGLLSAGDIMRAMMFSTAATNLRSADSYLAIQKLG